MLINVDTSRLPLAIERSHDKEMLSVTQEGSQTVVRVNYSSLSILQECPRKSYYTFERALRAKMDSPATLFGGAVHKAMEVFYSAPRQERTIPKGFNEESDLMAHGHPAPTNDLLYRCISAFLEHHAPLRGLDDKDKRSASSGVWMLQHYFKTYIDDPWEVYCDDGGPIVERRCEAVLFDSPELKIILFGSIDVILRNAQTGVILPADHKTASQVGNDFYNRLKPNHQYTGYFWLAREVLKIPGDGFLVNCLEVKSKPLTARGGPPKFPRQTTTRSEGDIEEFKQTVVFYVKQFLNWKKENFWPLGSVTICTNYGGCQFLEVCQAPDVIRETMIENKFVSMTKKEENEVK